MYRPAHFSEDRQDVLVAAVREIRFGMLVTFTGRELLGSHIPMLIIDDAGSLRIEGHVARGNAQWKEVDSAVDALAVFVGPHAYISPSWYASKPEHGRVVPTWNYISIQAAGPLSIIEDRDWLLRHVGELTEHNESGRDEPWRVADAPAEFIEQMCSGIVGFSLAIRKLEGKWKMAQHKSEADRRGAIEGLSKVEDTSAQLVAKEMLRLEEERLK